MCLTGLVYLGEVTGSCALECEAITTNAGTATDEILCSGTPISPSGWTAGNTYFRGPVPFTTPYPAMASDLVIYCGGGSARYAFLDEDNCVVAEGAVADFSCEGGITGTIDASTIIPEACFDDEACLSFLVHLLS